MIWCVWYPSGGFGHFVNAIISLRGRGFTRPQKSNLVFSTTGDSHALDLSAPKYFHDPMHYDFDFVPDQHYSVLIDNGITNTSDRFMQVFPGAKIIRMCYSDRSWPVVAMTMITKSMNRTFYEHLNTKEWKTTEAWAQREKYFLFLRDHDFRSWWRPDCRCTNIDVADLLEYECLRSHLATSTIELDDFRDLWLDWNQNNLKYFLPIQHAHNIVQAVKHLEDQDLTYITDLWVQAVVYYYIWLEYQFEVPHNDYSNWFTSTRDIAKMLKKHGVTS